MVRYLLWLGARSELAGTGDGNKDRSKAVMPTEEHRSRIQGISTVPLSSSAIFPSPMLSLIDA